VLKREARAGVPVELNQLLHGLESTEDRLRVAWGWVQQERDWYAKHGARSRNWFAALQIAAIVLAALTPVLVAWDGLPAALQALPAALAAIMIGASAVFAWRENWVRFKQTAAALEREQLLFATQTQPYEQGGDRDKLVAQLVENTSRIVSREYTMWGEAVSQHTSES
jgi:Protein of unknown function (DUF4231)